MPGISFDRAVEYYDETRGYPPGIDEQLRDSIIAHLGLGRDARLLEPGIGTGRIALPFIRAGYTYVGVDLSRGMMRKLRHKLTDRAQPVCLVCGDVMHLPFADASFDAAVLVHVLHLVDDWRQVLRETRRALREGGCMVLASDERGGEGDALPRARVHAAWSAILDELRVPPEQRRDGAPHGLDDRFPPFLEELGAEVRRTTLVAYRHVARTAREVAHQYQARLYSSCWALPDAVHTEAARRLQRWIDEECADPDTAHEAPARIDAYVARWP
ncbi:MAG: class I SAM-dependent methyltransferase [Chloroflexi bacterium]|nr:class I SAM-dependent methyltransferase [Chloroflexota bacterium]